VAERPGLGGLILAGGAGTRMGGEDKGWIAWQGAPLVTHVLGRLAPQVDRVFISANRNIDRYATLAPVLPDLRPGLPGPLAGIEAGLSAAPGGYLLVVPCDTPRLPVDLAARLLAAVGNTRKPAFVTTPAREQPLFALLHTDLLPHLTATLDRDERRVLAWIRAIGATAVPFDDAAAFANLNTPQSLAG
jgi:molybdopterin-guanine dinucleotide biosynthesis protein A